VTDVADHDAARLAKAEKLLERAAVIEADAEAARELHALAVAVADAEMRAAQESGEPARVLSALSTARTALSAPSSARQFAIAAEMRQKAAGIKQVVRLNQLTRRPRSVS
jgi:hypothetical protein